jgi:hypothetical protein
VRWQQQAGVHLLQINRCCNALTTQSRAGAGVSGAVDCCNGCSRLGYSCSRSTALQQHRHIKTVCSMSRCAFGWLRRQQQAQRHHQQALTAALLGHEVAAAGWGALAQGQRALQCSKKRSRQFAVWKSVTGIG